MELIELNVKSREKSGKGAARKLRSQNGIPAIVYGPKTEPAMLSLELIEFDRIIREHGAVGLFFNLKVDGAGNNRNVMLKDIQMDAFGLKYLHVDFHEIDMDAKVTITVPVEAVGMSRGVKEGGLLQIIRRELDIRCKPSDMPDSVKIDISGLDIGDSIHVEDIDLGEAVKIPHEVNFTVITIVPPTTAAGDGAEDIEEDVQAGAAKEAAGSE